MLIAICGIDGAGKTTHANMLVKRFKIKGYKAVYMRQHTSDYYTNSKLNKMLFDSCRETGFLEELAKYSAFDRMKQLNNNIIPQLEAGKIVVLDRYVFSSYSYYKSRGLNLNWLMKINSIMLPDITICLDIPINEARKRINRRKKITVEEKNDSFLQNIRYNYLNQIWGKTPNYCIIDSSKDIEKVHDGICKIIDRMTVYKIS